MHIVFQFPVVDFRPLLATESGKLPYPEWPNIGTSSKRFIRHFGAVEQRAAGGSDDWSGEGFYCNSHLTMRYDNLHKHGFELAPSIKAAIFNSYRRYSSAEHFLGRVEAGFVDNTEALINKHKLTADININDVLEHYCDLPVTLNGKQAKLARIGQKLADNYYLASTSVKVKAQEKNNLIKAGDVVIVMVFGANEQFKLPQYAFPVEVIQLPDNSGNLKVYGYKFKYHDVTYKVWLIKMPVNATEQSKELRATVRNLRINLLRIHLEKETIRILLNGINSKQIPLEPGSEQAVLADKYFQKTGEKIFQDVRYSFEQKNLLAFALHSEDSVLPGSFSQLEESIDFFKNKYVIKNIDKLLAGMAKKKILFICTSPKDTNPTGFDDEYRNIKHALRAGTDRDNYDMEIETSVKKNDFFDLLNYYKPDYLHLCMHTTLTEGLYFEDANKEMFPMPVQEFADFIKLYSEKRKPVCIILSACNSKAHAEAVKGYCNFAIGTQRVFPADAGIIYADSFYKTLFEDGNPDINYCHKAGILAIKSSKKDFGTYDIPVYEIPLLFS